MSDKKAESRVGPYPWEERRGIDELLEQLHREFSFDCRRPLISIQIAFFARVLAIAIELRLSLRPKDELMRLRSNHRGTRDHRRLLVGDRVSIAGKAIGAHLVRHKQDEVRARIDVPETAWAASSNAPEDWPMLTLACKMLPHHRSTGKTHNLSAIQGALRSFSLDRDYCTTENVSCSDAVELSPAHTSNSDASSVQPREAEDQ